MRRYCQSDAFDLRIVFCLNLVGEDGWSNDGQPLKSEQIKGHECAMRQAEIMSMQKIPALIFGSLYSINRNVIASQANETAIANNMAGSSFSNSIACHATQSPNNPKAN